MLSQARQIERKLIRDELGQPLRGFVELIFKEFIFPELDLTRVLE
jgi:hypothetical protein